MTPPSPPPQLFSRPELGPLALVLLVLLGGLSARRAAAPVVRLDIPPPTVCDCGRVEDPVLLNLTVDETRMNGELVPVRQVAQRFRTDHDPQFDPLFVYVDPRVSYARTYNLFEALRGSEIRVLLLTGEHAPDFAAALS